MFSELREAGGRSTPGGSRNHETVENVTAQDAQNARQFQISAPRPPTGQQKPRDSRTFGGPGRPECKAVTNFAARPQTGRQNHETVENLAAHQNGRQSQIWAARPLQAWQATRACGRLTFSQKEYKEYAWIRCLASWAGCTL